jgi:hypothetical protein
MSAIKRRNRISEQFSARPIELLESAAYRALSRSAHMVISRIEVELAHHGGNDNGRLPVTTDDFVAYGMHRSSVAPAVREAEALGFIRVTERGRAGNAEYRKPNMFYLTFSTWRGSPPTHEWRRIKTIEEATKIATDARANKNQQAIAQGKQSWRKRQQPRRDTISSRLQRPATIAGNRMPRTCTICRHPERLAIEADLRAGNPYRDIARRHNISKHALSRHRLNHLSRHTATALATTMKIKPLLDKAETAPTLNGTLLAIREARRCLEELVILLNSTVPSLPE